MSRELPAQGADLYCATCELHFTHGALCPHDGTRLVRLAAPGDPIVGRDLDGRYKILAQLGQGGMGAVYRARQHSMGREVAVKVVSPACVSDAMSIKRFLREAKLASRLVHPNIVAVLDFGQTSDGVFYLVMELVDGRTLHDEIVACGRIPVGRLVRIAAQMCDALEGAHRLPIIHRDLKPANVMLLAAGRDLVKVLDFGLAKSLAPDASTTTVTSAGALLGTPTFMPPEVANGDSVDARADLYSLGCILYAMGTGRPPFVTDSIPEMIAMHGLQPAPPMTGVPAPVARVIDRLLKKDPDARIQTAALVREALEAAVEASRTPVSELDTLDAELPVPADALTQPNLAPMRGSDEAMTGMFALPAATSGGAALARDALQAHPSVPPRRSRATRARSRLLFVITAALILVLVAIVDVAMRRSSRSGRSGGRAQPAPAIVLPIVLPVEGPAEGAAARATAPAETAIEAAVLVDAAVTIDPATPGARLPADAPRADSTGRKRPVTAKKSGGSLPRPPPPAGPPSPPTAERAPF